MNTKKSLEIKRHHTLVVKLNNKEKEELAYMQNKGWNMSKLIREFLSDLYKKTIF